MYNNPYNFYPYGINSALVGNSARTLARPSLLASFRNIKWGNLLTNTQKTLNVINQAIPVYYQMKPIVNNIKSFGKIMSAFKEEDKPNNINSISANNNPVNEKEASNGLPTFFID